MDPDIVAADFVLVDLDFNRTALANFFGPVFSHSLTQPSEIG